MRNNQHKCWSMNDNGLGAVKTVAICRMPIVQKMIVVSSSSLPLLIHHRMQITIRNVIIVVFNNCGIAVDRGLRCREVITSIMVCRHDKYAKMQALSLHIRCNNQQMLEYE